MAKTYRPPPNWPRANPHPWLYTFLGWLPAYLIGSIVVGSTHIGADPARTGSFRAGRVLGVGWIVIVVVALLARSSDRVWAGWWFVVASSVGMLVAVTHVLTVG